MGLFNWNSNSKAAAVATEEAKNTATATAADATQAAKPQGVVKPCCVCLETKKARDTCYFDQGDDAEKKCHYLVSAHRQCMADFGFKI
ncbi:hypothetical protein GGF44_000182 [Coemansia sp. RSA 1694]|nr:hypothetical protein GGF38_000742 [Coemansia sp. RSA 25]KAJ2547241.1 hypothetical protein GGH95_006670 [Coemansia sp. RSA 1836]KAJ2645047.1 hypothetical protein GGF44_000182 [Coemansia sp. RSA 1694]